MKKVFAKNFTKTKFRASAAAFGNRTYNALKCCAARNPIGTGAIAVALFAGQGPLVLASGFFCIMETLQASEENRYLKAAGLFLGGCTLLATSLGVAIQGMPFYGKTGAAQEAYKEAFNAAAQASLTAQRDATGTMRKSFLPFWGYGIQTTEQNATVRFDGRIDMPDNSTIFILTDPNGKKIACVRPTPSSGNAPTP